MAGTSISRKPSSRNELPPEQANAELETLLEEHGRLHFSRLNKPIEDLGPKRLTKTDRHMEANGLVSRTVLPDIWAERHRVAINQARETFREPRSATKTKWRNTSPAPQTSSGCVKSAQYWLKGPI